MITKLRRVVGPELAAAVQRHLALLVAYGVVQGLAFLLIVPALRALLAEDTDAAWQWTALLAATVVLSGVLYYVQSMTGYSVGLRLSRVLHERLGDHIAALPLGWFDGRRTGSVSRLATYGVQDVMGIPAHLLRFVVIGVVTPATVLVGIMAFDWRLGLTALAAAPLLALSYRWTLRLTQRSDEAVHETAADAAGRIVEFARAQSVLRAHTGDGDWQPLDDALLAQQQAGRRLMLRVVPGLLTFAVVVQLAVVATIAVGAALALGGSVDVALVVALLVLAVRFVEPLIAVADVGSGLRMSRSSLQRLADLLDEPTLPEPARSAPTGAASVELDGVSFGYEPGTPVLRDVSFTLAPGTTTAVVGPSGSGKTTLTRLVARFYDVDSGTVRVAGADVQELRTEDLMAKLALVFQDVYLFSGSILDNIRLGRPTATDEEVRAAARVARVDEIADRLPGGWQTEVGEGGARLSGGEKQRLSIARALLKDAPVVLLDEATAALDPINEAAVLDGLQALTADRTVLVIAHRLQTVVAADQILVLDQGAIVERGRHSELLAADGRYAAFWRSRAKAAGWRLAGAGSGAGAGAGAEVGAGAQSGVGAETTVDAR